MEQEGEVATVSGAGRDRHRLMDVRQIFGDHRDRERGHQAERRGAGEEHAETEPSHDEFAEQCAEGRRALPAQTLHGHRVALAAARQERIDHREQGDAGGAVGDAVERGDEVDWPAERTDRNKGGHRERVEDQEPHRGPAAAAAIQAKLAPGRAISAARPALATIAPMVLAWPPRCTIRTGSSTKKFSATLSAKVAAKTSQKSRE